MRRQTLLTFVWCEPFLRTSHRTSQACSATHVCSRFWQVDRRTAYRDGPICTLLLPPMSRNGRRDVQLQGSQGEVERGLHDHIMRLTDGSAFSACTHRRASHSLLTTTRLPTLCQGVIPNAAVRRETPQHRTPSDLLSSQLWVFIHHSGQLLFLDNCCISRKSPGRPHTHSDSRRSTVLGRPDYPGN